MDNALIVAGLGCLIAAVVGGGLKAFQLEFPPLASPWRQGLLALLGAVLLGISAREEIARILFPPERPRVVMGPLLEGVNLQGGDFSNKAEHADNKYDCAELCRQNSECKAMTYVISRQWCWLKASVPAQSPEGGPDYVSAVKQ